MISTSKRKRLDNIPESLDKYVKEEFPVVVNMALIWGSQEEFCKFQFALQFIFGSRTETSITIDWVGPPKSVVTVVVDEAIRLYIYISVRCENQGITSSQCVVVFFGGLCDVE